MTIFELCDL